jgi:hypothetical protein
MSEADDQLGVMRLLAQYCQWCDAGDLAAVARLWAPAGELLYDGELVVGHAAIEAWFEGKAPPERRGKHLTTNVIADIVGDRALVASDYAFLRMEGGVIGVPFAGRYVDTLVRVDGTWRFARREIVLLTGADGSG